jgi:uncharacterized circularly permuted ATP-grasp superfamily protein/uncharacterized alpha-E superfamily protein
MSSDTRAEPFRHAASPSPEASPAAPAAGGAASAAATDTGPWYAPAAGLFDETRAADGSVRPHWDYLAQALQGLGISELGRRRDEARRLLRENGVSYNVYDDPDGYNRVWDLDPIPLVIGSTEWSDIESALIQRAELMDLILRDLYGPRELLKKGLLPPELVFGHAGFLRQCDGVKLPGNRQLILYSANLARGADGRMCVLGDRTQAPSGAGYALENRMVITRVLPSLFRDSRVHRVAVFFRALRQTLAAIAPRAAHEPRIVILTPGPRNETYFEHAYLASYLGYALVQGDDLVVRNGRVWQRTLAAPQPVDVIVRRVDDDFCDPLELRPESRLGVTGLLDCVRRGNVTIANPLGSGLLENPALLAFLPAIARHFLGQPLRLNSVPTWWCGSTTECQHVLTHLDKLVVKPLSRAQGERVGERVMIGPSLTRVQLAQLRAQILAEPRRFVGQELASFSSAPTLGDTGVEPRAAVLRTFLVARDADYAVMPGGLTRVAGSAGNPLVSNQSGGSSKDTWVLASEPERQVTLWLQPAREQMTSSARVPLSSRAADNLFWLGRYAERAEGTARLLRTILQKYDEMLQYDDASHSQCLHTLLRALTHFTATYPGFMAEDAQLHAPEDELLAVARDPLRTGSLAQTLQALLHSAHAIRDFWSTDAWRVLDGVDNQLAALRSGPLSIETLGEHLNQVVVSMAAFNGLTSERLMRDQAWRFLDMGRRVERALLLASLTRSTVAVRQDEATEALLLDSVLSTVESILTYRQRYRSYLEVRTVLELMLLDANNPRGMIHQLLRLQESLSGLPRDARDDGTSAELAERDRLALEAITQLRLVSLERLVQLDPGSVLRRDLDQTLARITHLVGRMSEVITEQYFGHLRETQQLQQATLEIR